CPPSTAAARAAARTARVDVYNARPRRLRAGRVRVREREGFLDRRYTLDDARRSYTPEKRWAELQGDLPSYLLYRPLSLWLTPPALRLRVPILAVTLASGACALAMPFCAWLGGAYGYLWVAGLGFVAHVCDCLDGN